MSGCNVQHDVIVCQSIFSGFNLLCIQSNRLNNNVSVVNKASVYTDLLFSPAVFPLRFGGFHGIALLRLVCT